MKKNIIIWVAAIVLVIIAVYTTQNYNAKPDITINPPVTPTPAAGTEPGDNSSEAENQQEPVKTNLMKDYDFELEDLNGNKITLSELKGKKVFLNFWATWCPPCKTEMPDIEKLYQETKDSDVVILAVNVGEDKKTVQDFITKNNYTFTVLLDTTGEVSQLYQVTGIPTSYFIDTEGYLDDGVQGAISLESMKKYVNNLD